MAYSYIRDNMQRDLKLYTWIGMKPKNLVPNIQSIKSVAFFWFSGRPMVRWKDRRGPDPYPLDNCFELKSLLPNMLAFFNIEALKLHLCRTLRHLLKLRKYVWPVGVGSGGRSSPPEKELLRTEKKGKQFP